MSTSPLMSANFVRLLDKRLKKVYKNKFAEYDSGVIPQLFNVESDDKAFQEFWEIGNVPDVRPHNGALEYKAFSPGYYTKIEPKEYSAGMIFERKLIDDEKYGVMEGRAEMLATATARTLDKLAVDPFNTAFSSAYTFMTSEEGKPLCSSTHTTKSGVSTASGFSNAGVSAASKTSIAATRILMMRFRNDIAELMGMNPDTIVCPVSQVDAVYEAVGHDPRSGAKSDKDPNSANHMINRSMGFKVIPLLRLDDNSTTNWFMVDSAKMKQHLHWVNRIKPEYNTTADFETFALKNSVYFRVGYGHTAWQWIYGHNVS